MQVNHNVSEISTLGSQTTASGFKSVINAATGRDNGQSEYENGINYTYSTVFPVSKVDFRFLVKTPSMSTMWRNEAAPFNEYS